MEAKNPNLLWGRLSYMDLVKKKKKSSVIVPTSTIQVQLTALPTEACSDTLILVFSLLFLSHVLKPFH